MNQTLALTAALALLAGSALACNPWISPTDTACAGMALTVTSSSPVIAPITSSVTPTGLVTGSLVWNSNGVPCIVSATGIVKLTSVGTTCNFAPAN